jgi:hypothetical protein
MTRAKWMLPLALAATAAAWQPAKKPFQAQGSSTISYHVDEDEEIVETTNITWHVTGTDIPGRPKTERLVLRTTTKEKEVLGDIGSDSTVTIEAWPLGADFKTKPIYAITETGLEGRVFENTLLQFSRGTEEVDWWSIYRLGTGQHLFDTHVPPIIFSTTREFFIPRFGALDVPPDDTKDARLKEPHVVAVLIYASEEKVIREAMITADDTNRAAELRSFADTHCTLALRETPSLPPVLRLRFLTNDKVEKETLLEIPIAKDDIDVTAARLPAGLHIKLWKR